MLASYFRKVIAKTVNLSPETFELADPLIMGKPRGKTIKGVSDFSVNFCKKKPRSRVGAVELTYPTLPWLCSACGLNIVNRLLQVSTI